MAGNIKGITIEFRGETSQLEQSIKKVDASTKNIDKSLKQVNSALKFNPTSIELWRQKQDLLKQKIGETEQRLKLLKQQQATMDAAGVDKQSAEYQNLQREIITTESKLKTFKGQLKQIGNVNLKAASEQFSAWGSSLEAAGQKMQGLSMAAAGVVASLGAISYKAGQNADDLNTLSKVYGINTTDLQKYSVAADLVDVSVEDIAKSHVKLEKSMYSASNGSSSMMSAFDQLGVSVTNADGTLRSSDAVWQDTITALGQVENETERDALAMQLMGKSAAQLNPLIEDQGETYKNLTDTLKKYDLDFVDQETLDGANQFNDALDEMKAIGSVALAQVGTQLASYLAPALEKVVDLVGRFANWLSKLSPEVLTVIGVVAGVVAAIAPVLIVLGKLATGISAIINLVGIIGPAIGGIVAAAGPVIAIIAAVIAIGVLLYKNWDVIKAKAIAVWNAIKAFFVNTLNSIKNTFTNIWNGIKTTIMNVWNSMKTFITNGVNGWKIILSNAWNSIKNTASSVWNGIKSAITNPIQTALNVVKGIVNKLKNLFPLKVGKIFSNLKIPHIKVNGGKAPFGIGGKGSAPHISVDWYAQGGIFTRPTLLGANGGRLAGVGEAGAEAVLPIERLREMVDFGNAQGNAIIAQQTQILIAIYEELQKEKNFKVDGVWAGRYVNSLVR